VRTYDITFGNDNRWQCKEKGKLGGTMRGYKLEGRFALIENMMQIALADKERVSLTLHSKDGKIERTITVTRRYV